MRSKVSLMAAPTALSPGGYVAKAYAGRSAPRTPVVQLDVERADAAWRIRLEWACAEPVRALDDQVDRFVDAAAVLAPATEDAPWISMGAPGKAVEGALWRADRERLFAVRAEGLGSVERRAAPEAWRARAEWGQGRWQLSLDLPGWEALDAQGRIAIAVWQGAQGDRAGLKSVSAGWLEVASR